MRKMVGTIVLAILFLLPYSVNAKVSTKFKECSHKCNDTTCQATCKLILNTNEKVEITKKDPIEATLTLPEGVTLKEVVPGKRWINNGSDNNLKFVPKKTKLWFESTIDLATLKFEYSKENPNNEVSLDVKNEGVIKIDISLDSIENASTGANLPLITIGGAFVLAGIFYLVSRRKTMMHNI